MTLIYFFFSSRRRHTRLQGEWSSDVCSSDLIRGALGAGLVRLARQFVTEGILLALCGAILGVALSFGGVRLVQLTNAGDRKSTRLNSSHLVISYAVFCLKKKKQQCEATIASI